MMLPLELKMLPGPRDETHPASVIRNVAYILEAPKHIGEMHEKTRVDEGVIEPGPEWSP
jgi:hypothetical protein